MSSNFIDYVKIHLKSGTGGAGSMHFRREKHVEKGGPDGGDGGRGGHVVVRGNKQLWTLLHLKYRKHVVAVDGIRGDRNRSSGAQGKDEVLEAPIGTVIKLADTDEVLGEITHDQQEIIVFAGGRGGMGNTHFKTPTNQAPRKAQPGEEGRADWVVMELKLLADVGLVGFPNAGKSTLLATVSAAKPEIADYPFTTLVPNLGVVSYRNHQSFVMADIPGIIEGAAEGRGLGIRFLRHIERNSILLFMIAATSENVAEEYKILLNELQQYNPELLDKQRIIAISQCDLVDEKTRLKLLKKLPANIPSVALSSVTGLGISQMKDLVWDALN